jgi:tetratricopeptide (TPR) repeat protein
MNARVQCLALLAVLFCAGAVAQAPDARNADAIQADLLFQQGNLLDAIPLYERLAKQSPKDPRYAERLAFALYSKAVSLPTGPERVAVLARAKKEAERAQALGNTGMLPHVVLEGVNHPEAAKNRRDKRMNEAELAFSKGDLDTALAAYLEIAATDPTSYEARLFAGDVYFRRRDFQNAIAWFEKAVKVNPDIETGYRYWGDALMGAGDMDGAKHKFIDAVVADPYSRRPWAGLKQWADRNDRVIIAPVVTVPAAPTVTEGADKKQDVVIHLDEKSLEKPDVAVAWLAYSTNRALWRTEKFAKRFPGEKEYRLSLAEEVESLEGVVTVLGELKRIDDIDDENLRTLVELSRAEMLEPFVLIAGVDKGIRQDYAAYRKEHADRLHAFVDKHLLHPKGAENGSGRKFDPTR